jgi:diguanylate cyclase (GGDEF)-like protein
MEDVLSTRCLDFLPFNWSEKNRAERACCLICIHPTDRLGQAIPLGNAEILIGRDAGCHVELPDDSVSRRHALLRPTETGFVVVDLGSTNGTYVNESRVDVRVLEPSDRVRFGNQIFKYLSADRLEAEYFENAYRMMTTDGLTQVYNKRYLIDVAERELRRTARTLRPLSLLMIDLDDFKSINDTFGHLAGDEVLIEFSRRLRLALRGDDVLARYGGDEFCLVLPDTALCDALHAAERLRVVVVEKSFPTEHAAVGVTVSIGVACAEANSQMSVAQLIEQADRQLYAAKRAGRNQVVG